MNSCTRAAPRRNAVQAADPVAVPRLEDRGDGNWRLSGDLTFASVAGLVKAPDFRGQPRRTIRVDLSEVTRAESAGLALLLEWQRSAEANDKSIAYINMPGQMQSMAAVCGLLDILQAA